MIENLNTNSAHVVGRVCREPEVHYDRRDNPIVTLTILTHYEYETKGGEVYEEQQWHRAVLYYDAAKSAMNLRIGATVEVHGRLKTNKYQDRAGHDQYTTQIIVTHFKILDR
jgi:single-strand DNA-binding protein